MSNLQFYGVVVGCFLIAFILAYRTGPQTPQAQVQPQMSCGMDCQRKNIDDALAYAIAHCNSDFNGPSQATQELRAVCMMSAQSYANGKMAQRD